MGQQSERAVVFYHLLLKAKNGSHAVLAYNASMIASIASLLLDWHIFPVSHFICTLHI